MAEQNIQFNFVVSPSQQERVIDHLMSYPNISGFSMVPIMGFSKHHSSFDIAEQVRGYRKQASFQVIVSSIELAQLKASLTRLLSNQRVRYWCVLLNDIGHLGDEETE